MRDECGESGTEEAPRHLNGRSIGCLGDVARNPHSPSGTAARTGRPPCCDSGDRPASLQTGNSRSVPGVGSGHTEATPPAQRSGRRQPRLKANPHCRYRRPTDQALAGVTPKPLSTGPASEILPQHKQCAEPGVGRGPLPPSLEVAPSPRHYAPLEEVCSTAACPGSLTVHADGTVADCTLTTIPTAAQVARHATRRPDSLLDYGRSTVCVGPRPCANWDAA